MNGGTNVSVVTSLGPIIGIETHPQQSKVNPITTFLRNTAKVLGRLGMSNVNILFTQSLRNTTTYFLLETLLREKQPTSKKPECPIQTLQPRPPFKGKIASPQNQGVAYNSTQSY